MVAVVKFDPCNSEDMILSSIIPIPKDKAGNKCNSANYRGISLSTSLSKILDIVTLERYKSTLCTSDLQFAFKVGHSTSMCTFVLREVVNYFVQRNTPVYCCLLDASKAFDRLRFDKLFSTLLGETAVAGSGQSTL